MPHFVCLFVFGEITQATTRPLFQVDGSISQSTGVLWRSLNLHGVIFSLSGLHVLGNTQYFPLPDHQV